MNANENFLFQIENDAAYQIRMILCIFIIFGHTLLPSYACEQIIEKSSLIAVEAYNLKWYQKSPVIRKMLQLIIMRSQKTVGISAGKFYLVSLTSFATVMMIQQ